MNNTPYRLEVRAEEASRIDAYLADQFQEISRSQIKKIIDAGEVLLDGSVVEKPEHCLNLGALSRSRFLKKKGMV